MCLSTVYETKNGKKEIMSNVANINIDNGKIYLYDILGRCTIYDGQIKRIDLNSNEIELS